MKKLICLLSATLLMLTSCSSDNATDDQSNNDGNSVLLKKSIVTYDGESVTYNYNYNGNKLVSVVNDGGDSNCHITYTGDLITKMEYGDGDEQTNFYEYDSSYRLVTFKMIEALDDLGHKETYVYNSDGTISVTEYIGDATTQTELNGTGTVTFLNGEVSQIESTSSSGVSYTYDDKNNPFKNVLGIDKIAFAGARLTDGILHNVVSETGENETSYTYTYNSGNYPLTSTETYEGEVTVEQFFYE